MTAFGISTTLVAPANEWLSRRRLRRASAQSRSTGAPRRVLAVLECRQTDDAVCARAVAVAAESGGYLTLVAVAPKPFPWLSAGPYCVPRVTREELQASATSALARAAALVPPDIPLLTAVDEGKTADVIARCVEAAAHDLVIVRRCRLRIRSLERRPRVPVLAVAS
jgi:hypothetical protein